MDIEPEKRVADEFWFDDLRHDIHHSDWLGRGCGERLKCCILSLIGNIADTEKERDGVGVANPLGIFVCPHARKGIDPRLGSIARKEFA